MKNLFFAILFAVAFTGNAAAESFPVKSNEIAEQLTRCGNDFDCFKRKNKAYLLMVEAASWEVKAREAKVFIEIGRKAAILKGIDAAEFTKGIQESDEALLRLEGIKRRLTEEIRR